MFTQSRRNTRAIARAAFEALEPRQLFSTYIVSSDADSEPGSLRQAIVNSNANSGSDAISFAIPGGGAHTINLLSALPDITDRVTIDGTSQAGYSGTPLIELNGAATADAAGLHLLASTNSISGLAIDGFTGPGILVDSASNTISLNTIENNVDDGIRVNAFSSNAISQNVVSANLFNGIHLVGSSGTSITGNFIGTDSSGAAAMGNQCMGISIEGAAGNFIGGTTAADRNIISANQMSGIEVSGMTAKLNLIRGNYIGTDATGSAVLGNTTDGIFIAFGSSNTISGNLISANQQNGVELSVAASNTIQTNRIGTNAAGATALANGVNGVYLVFAHDNFIGGANTSLGNTIAFNGKTGVCIIGKDAIHNLIRCNSIFANTRLGIDLNDDGVTLNDASDADKGANDLKNFPVLTSVATTATSVTIKGTLNTSPKDDNFIVDFYATPTAHAHEYGEGERYLGNTTVHTDGNGNASFNVTFNQAVANDEVITATTTPVASNNPATSEFSRAMTSAGPAVPAGSPSISITDESILEGNHGTRNLVFTVTLSEASSDTVQVAYNTTHGTANSYDFYDTHGTLTFNPGQTSKTITIVIKGDTTREADEDFYVNLTNPLNATLAKSKGHGIIKNDD